MALAGSAGVPELVLALATGATVGAGLLVGFGSPNRRPAPAAVARRAAARPASTSRPSRSRAPKAAAPSSTAPTPPTAAASSRCTPRTAATPTSCTAATARCCCAARTTTGRRCRSSTTSSTRRCCCCWPRQAGVRRPRSAAVTELAGRVDGARDRARRRTPARRARRRARSMPTLLDAVWRRGRAPAPGAARAPRRCAPPTSSSPAVGRVVIDLGFGEEAASPRLQAIDRAELLASLAALVGADAAVASAARVLDARTTWPRPRRTCSRSRCRPRRASRRRRRCSASCASQIAAVTGEEPLPLERLVRVRPRTLLMIAVAESARSTCCFPQLADVGDSFTRAAARRTGPGSRCAS